MYSVKDFHVLYLYCIVLKWAHFLPNNCLSVSTKCKMVNVLFPLVYGIHSSEVYSYDVDLIILMSLLLQLYLSVYDNEILSIVKVLYCIWI